MSLSFRLNLVFAALFALLLVVGAVSIIAGARQSVADEIDSSVQLALELLAATAAGVGSADDASALQAALIERANTLGRIRHLDIALLSLDGRPHASGDAQPPRLPTDAPRWFVRLVAPETVEYRHRLSPLRQADTPPALILGEIAVRPDPADEISEAWGESRRSLILLLVFALLAIPLFYMTVRRSFRPMQQILLGMEDIQQGRRPGRLPRFDLPELDRIARGFNAMADELRRKDDENRTLRKRALEIREREQRHLARELHDEMGQSISAVKALAVSIRRQPDNTRRNHDSGATIANVCDEMYDSVRRMMERLRPEVFELGLEAALRRTVEDWNERHAPTHCALKIAGSADRLDEQSGIKLLRIVQEALTNAARHASASHVRVTLTVHEDGPGRLTVEDDGVGFDVAGTARGLGLQGMIERINSLDGALEVQSSPGAGTRLGFSFPLPAPSHRTATGQ